MTFASYAVIPGCSTASTPAFARAYPTATALWRNLANALKSTALSMGLDASTVASGKSLTMAMAIFAVTAGVVACYTERAVEPVIIEIVEAGSYVPEPEPVVEPTPPPCVHREKVVLSFDGGSVEYDMPTPCDPFWKYKDLGYPKP